MPVIRIRASSRDGGPFATVPVLITGDTFYRMFLDTGATRTVITPKLAADLGLRVRNGRVVVAGSLTTEAGIAVLPSLQIGRIEDSRVIDLTVRVLDLPVADGALGLDYLSRFRSVCYDFDNHTLELTTR